MIKNQICKIAEMKPTLFNAHRTNGNLPFEVVSPIDEKNPDSLKWWRGDIHHAAFLIAARMLADEQGVGWAFACSILRQEFVRTSDLALRYSGKAHQRPGIHIAAVNFTPISEPLDDLPTRYMEGPIASIIADAQRYCDKLESRRTSKVIEIRSIVSIDLSLAYRIAISRAAALQIDVNDDENEADKDQRIKADNSKP